MHILQILIRQSLNIKISFFLLISAFSIQLTYAQISSGGFPITMQFPKLKSTQFTPEYQVKSVDVTLLEKEDNEFPKPSRYGVYERKEIDIKEEGCQITIDNPKGKIWRYKISAREFHSLQLKFSRYYLPENAKLFIYNESYTKILGAFTSKNNNADSALFISVLHDNHSIIEYYEPLNSEIKGQLILEGIVKIYKDYSSTQLTDDQHNLIGINCKEGRNWQDVKHSVCMIRYIKDGSSYFCSGALLNNIKKDGKPYFLTANHCIDEMVNTSNVLVSFNYENSNCYGELHDQNQYTLSGARFLTTGNESDFTLLLLNQTPPEKYQPYYSGWDASNADQNNSVCIHHPNGNPKKISLDNDPPRTYIYSIPWYGDDISPANSHWKVSFDKGRTEKGSSGSPLFGYNKRIIGQLHGGDDNNEYFGKLSYSWNNQDQGYNSLSYYLDPDNTGIKSMDGAHSMNLLPDPQVYIDFHTVCPATPIQLSGFSAFKPTSWNWEFTPDNISYHDGTSSSTQNPIVSFDSPGMYTIKLTVSNEMMRPNGKTGGDSTIQLINYVKADSEINMTINPATEYDSCLCKFDTLNFIARGAYDLTWNFSGETEDSFYIVNKNANPITIRSIYENPPSQDKTIELSLQGKHGTCSSTINYTFPFVIQPNDNLSNAIQIIKGKNGPYSNKCATVEIHEPKPPAYSCTAQDAWCDEYNVNESSIDNSVWFYYKAESTDQLTLASEGFNNQLAIYLAENPADIFNGNFLLVAANDNASENKKDPVIDKINTQAGKTYWIQVDGSDKGKEGTFFLNLRKYGESSVDVISSTGKIRVYPQPAENQIFIDNQVVDMTTGTKMRIYNLEGVCLIAKEYTNAIKTIDISELEKGIYLLLMTNKQNTYSCKFVK